ncbi:MAG TPA: hypothetical protein VGF30_02515 [Bacteroidia bacterium]
MRDVIWTIIVVWVLYRLYNAFFSGSRRTVVYQKHDHHHYNQEGKVNVETNTAAPKKPKRVDESEYTDFEEIKD